MNDPRVLYLTKAALSAFGSFMPDLSLEEFLTRNGGQNADLLKWFIDESYKNKSFDDVNALIFYPLMVVKELNFKYYGKHVSTHDDESKEDVSIHKPAATRKGKKPANLNAKRKGAQAAKKKTSLVQSTSKENETGQASSPKSETELTTGNSEESLICHTVTREFAYTILYVTKPPLTSEIQAELNSIFYIVRKSSEKIPNVLDLREADSVMPNYFENGYLPNDVLRCNSNIVAGIYTKMLAYYTQRLGNKVNNSMKVRSLGTELSKPKVSRSTKLISREDSKDGDNDDGGDHIEIVEKQPAKKENKQVRDEFNVSLHKFCNVMTQTLNSLSGHFVLEKPDIELPEKDEDVIGNIEMDEVIIGTINNWTKQIGKAQVEMEKNSPHVTKGPLSEVEYWRHRASVFTGMIEELKSPYVARMISLYERLTQSDYFKLEEIRNLMYEAKDNVRFLTLVERHFKNVQFGANFEVVTETLVPMMQSLRLIWTISRNYNKDERLGPLLQMIAGSLCDRVSRVMEISSLFERDIDDIMTKSQVAKKMLDMYMQTYFSERKIVETTAQDNRWEFDRKVLFGEVMHMKEVCEDIYQMVKSAKEFYKLFGPELKNITGDSDTLDEVLNLVDGLFNVVTSQINERGCIDPFRLKNKDIWTDLRDVYQETVEAIDTKAKNFINDYFSHIRSSVNAFDLLMKLKAIQSRQAISDLLQEKYRDVLRGYSTELMRVDIMFRENQDCPTIARYVPPKSGAIMWARLIFDTMKKPILRFMEAQEDIYETDDGAVVKERYVKLGRGLRDYETDLHRSWYNDIESRLSNLMNQPIFKRIQRSVDRENAEAGGDSNAVSKAALVKKGNPLPGITKLGNNALKRLSISYSNPLGYNFYSVNFDPKLWSAIAESKYMEVLDLKVPEIARIVGLQEVQCTHTVLQLQRIINRYDTILNSLDAVKSVLLKERMTLLCTLIDQGTWMLNWDSLPCDEFINRCDKTLITVESGLREIEKCNHSIEDMLKKLLRVNMFKKKKKNMEGQYPSAKAFIEYAETSRENDMRTMANKTNTEICSFLQRLEECLYMTKTGESSKMKGLYIKYETRILHQLIKMVDRNMWNFVNQLDQKQPLFYVDVILINSDVVIHPVVLDLYKWLRQSLRGCIESTHHFVRWKYGTCEVCPPVRIEGQDAPFIFSHSLEIERLKEVYEPEAAFDQKVKAINHYVMNFLKKLVRYSSLWKQDKSLIVERWVSTKPQTAQYETRIIAIMNQIRSIERILGKDKVLQIGSITLRMLYFHASIQEHRKEWIRLYLKALMESAQQIYADLDKMMQTRLEILESEPSTLEEMKIFLANITEIEGGMSEHIDKMSIDLSEKHRIIRLYGDEIDSSVWNFSNDLMQRWKDIALKAKIRSQQILPTKNKFAAQVSETVKLFAKKVAEFVERYKTKGPGNEAEDLDRGYSVLSDFMKESAELDRERIDLLNSERLLDLPISSYPDLKQTTSELEKLVPVYDLYVEQKNIREEWSCVLWKDLDVKMMTNAVDEFIERFKAFSKKTKMIPAARTLNSQMKNFIESLQLIQNLKNDALRDRHWKKLMETTGIAFDIDPSSFTLAGVFAMELHQFAEEISIIVGNAERELQIEKGIEEIKTVWADLKFVFSAHQRQGAEAVILGSLEEIQQYLDDHMVNLQSMGSSRFAAPFLPTVRHWEKDLTLVSDTIDAWLMVQRKWMYLEAIFMAGDIAQQLPMEAKRFAVIDKSFTQIMASTVSNPLVISSSLADNRLNVLNNLHEMLDICQKALNDYLDSKRNAFPRFFFISDDELLSILGGKEPEVIQEHIIKIFDNICMLNMQMNIHNNKVVRGMTSCEKEVMEYRQEVVLSGRVEEWMVTVEEEMRRTNRLITKEAVFYYCNRKSRVKWMFDYQGMMILAGNQIWFTWEVEDTFIKTKKGKRSAMKDFGKKCADQISDIVYTVRAGLNKNDMNKFETVLILDVHSRDIIDSFIRDSITQKTEFEWESQLRFYWVRNIDDICIRQCSGEFGYGYEYFGLNGRLVITPLTDRIYLTLTQALSMYFGGAPAGPAGTGKTETTKDLAKALGLLCVVTNCGDGMDFKSFGKLLSGLCQCGAWGCFDEFNRIDVSVLSVVSTQIKTIQNALAMKLTRFTFEGAEIKLDDRVGLFITMNPGYAGRTELPESVKALFRPVVVIVPDLEYICEIMLFSQGFLTARNLAKKMTTMYKLAKEQLSQQYHYDFGLRALKSVLVMAGGVRRDNPDVAEDKLLMRALRDMNLPKFVFDDVPLFRGLITDLFPGLQIASVSHEDLAEIATVVFADHGYTVVEKQVEKVIQFYSTLLTRHSVMVVGPTCGGKTTVIKTFCEAQTRKGIPSKLFTINPKERTVNELYGLLDPATRDWTDGLLSYIFRKINAPVEKIEHRYLLFDGDVDALWIENMNSVMDDNRLLTLVNGERIRLQNFCWLLFEVGDLQYASPATVSRCGMVYVDPKDLGYEPYWIKWIKNLEKEEARELMNNLFNKYVPSLMECIFEGIFNGEQGKSMKSVVPQNSLSMIIQLCFLLDSQINFKPSNEDDLSKKNSETRNLICNENADIIESSFIHSLTWSLGAALVEKDRIKFDNALRQLSGLPSTTEETEKKFAKAGSLPSVYPHLSDYLFDVKSQSWLPWAHLVPTYEHQPDVRFTEILVPTVETVKIDWALKQHMKVNRPLVLIGETGTSKSATALTFLKSLSPEVNSVLYINFSSRTSSLDVQRNFESNVEKRAKGIYGPTPGKILLIFIDDLSMPQIDDYGTQQPIALLKLLVENGGMYDRGKELTWKHMKDLTYSAAMGLPGGGRNNVDPRFLSLFSMYHCGLPSDDSLTRIFGSILTGHCKEFTEKVTEILDTLTQITIETYKNVKKKLLPTPTKFHYSFNLRDLSKIFQGLCLASVDKFTHCQQILRLWRHECLRVFADRMISQTDRQLISSHLHAQIIEHFEITEDYVMQDPIIFGDYWAACSEEEPRLYDDLQDYELTKALFQEVIEVFNENEGKMDLVLFNDALDHLNSIHRILRMDGGHALLVGVSGSGKRSLARLAAFTAELNAFEISLSRNYREKEFREDLKILYNKIATDKKDLMFIFGDQQIAEEGFLELINNMLTTGMVPALFADDERDNLLSQIWDKGVKAGYPGTKEGIFQYFKSQCAARLHIVLCMSPVGDKLRDRCRNFPGVVSNTTIDWFFPWPEQALFSVACYMIDPKNPLIPQQHWESLVCHVVKVHGSVESFSELFRQKLRRDNYVTATNYVDFINSYLKLLEKQNLYVESQCKRLTVGLDKLEDTAIQIKELNVKLAEQTIIVEEKTTSVQALMVEIESSSKEAAAKKKFAEEKTVEVTQQSKVIVVEQAEAEEALAEAQPALDAAKAALDELEKADVTEIRAFSTPPKLVQFVGECLCYIMQAGEISWKAARGLMADANFIGTLQTMDVEAIPNKNINSIKDLISKRKATYEEIRSASKAGGGFFKFVLSVISFYEVAKEIRPKRERVKQLEKEFAKAKKELAKLNEAVEKLEEDLRSMRKRFEEAQDEMERLNKAMAIMQRQLLAAEKLTTGLASEKTRKGDAGDYNSLTRSELKSETSSGQSHSSELMNTHQWTQELSNLYKERVKLLGDCLLSAAFLSYLGPFTSEFRHKLFYNTWYADLKSKQVPTTKNFKVQNLLTNEVEISKWNSQGLPPDELSIQNAILTTKGSRSPLCIDPQEQAVKWIKKMEYNKRDESKSIRISTFNDPTFLRSLENGIKFGTPFLFEAVDEAVDPVIDNVLSKNIQVDKGREFIMLGDREVDWEPTFRLYLTSKLANPKFSPNLFSRAMVINYTVTVTGLEGQLLSALVKYERRELEERREKLIQETSENKRILKDLEDRLLLELATQTGNILDNWDLINTLEDTKAKAVEVAKQLEQSIAVSADVETQRDGYRPAAKRGAILFFVLAELALVGNMYQFSLSSYLVVFLSAVRKAMPDSSLAKRLSNIIKTLTYHVYTYGCTGIFEKHKLLLSFQLAIRLEQDKGNVAQSEISFFIKGNVSVDDVAIPKPAEWIPEDSWRDLVHLSEYLPKTFGDIVDDIKNNLDVWKDFYDDDFPDVNPYPLQYDKLAPFQKLCLLRSWRVDRVPNGIAEYVASVMDRSFVSPPITTFKVAYQSSAPNVPVVVIVSPGCDPPAELVKLSQAEDFEVHRLKYLSMGQGQESNAEALLENSVARGYWLMLQNAHLLVRWLPCLEKRIDDLSKPHPDFRLWLTTEPVSNFPIGILQKSYKVVMEPPSGLRQNINSTFHKLSQNFFLLNKHPRFRPLIYTLGFLHAVLQERRRYGKIGYNVPYDFSESDFYVSSIIIDTYLTRAFEQNRPELPWGSIKYLIGEVMYGGRAIDNYDRRILTTYMDEYFGDFLFDEFQPFFFYYDDDVEYYVPEEPEKCSTIKEIYTDYIKQLPFEQRLGVFGLHTNAMIGYCTTLAKTMWSSLIELQPETDETEGEDSSAPQTINSQDSRTSNRESVSSRASSASVIASPAKAAVNVKSTEAIVGQIVEGILERLPVLYDVARVKKTLLIGEILPTSIVLLQELDRFNLLLRKMFLSLNELKRALAGEAGMSHELDDVLRCMSNGLIPKVWRNLAPNTEKNLASWINHLLRRNDQYTRWIGVGKLEIPVMWLSGLQIPESYITALIQKACRRNGWALDKCALMTTVTNVPVQETETTFTMPPELGCNACGLYLEGAAWDVEKGYLIRQPPRQLVQEMPVMKLIPVERHKLKLTNTLKCPVYVTSQRRNAMGVGLVFETDLYTEEHSSHWILMGTALILNTD